MRLILFDGGVREQTNVVMDVKVEKRARFPPCFVDYEVIESVMLVRLR